MGALILYIEDNVDNMNLMRRAIEAIGHTMVGASNGGDGLANAVALLPDLILLDINLPDIDGYTVARRIRASGIAHLLYVPIIAITANVSRGDSDRALEAGCDVYMPKPVNIRELWQRVEGLLEAARGLNPQRSEHAS